MNEYQQNRLEEMIADAAGRAGISLDDRKRARLENARRAKAERPYFLNAELEGTYPANVPVNIQMPESGLDFPAVFSGAATSAQNDGVGGVFFSIVRRKRADGERSVIYNPSQHARPSVLAGDLNVGANRVTYPDFLPFAEPIAVNGSRERREVINLEVLSGTDDPVTLGNLHFLLRGTRIYPDTFSEAQFDEAELRSIATQIARTELNNDRRIVIPCHIDPLNIEMPAIGEWGYLLGFQSVAPTGHTTDDFLHWSALEITDARGHQWSNTDSIPIAALCAFPLDDKIVNWKMLDRPYLLSPDARQLVFSRTSYDATDPDAYPPDVMEATVGFPQMIALVRPI